MCRDGEFDSSQLRRLLLFCANGSESFYDERPKFNASGGGGDARQLADRGLTSELPSQKKQLAKLSQCRNCRSDAANDNLGLTLAQLPLCGCSILTRGFPDCFVATRVCFSYCSFLIRAGRGSSEFAKFHVGKSAPGSVLRVVSVLRDSLGASRRLPSKPPQMATCNADAIFQYRAPPPTVAWDASAPSRRYQQPAAAVGCAARVIRVAVAFAARQAGAPTSWQLGALSRCGL